MAQNEPLQSFLKVRGAQVEATYIHDTGGSGYSSNPLNEALPRLMSTDELIQRLPLRPEYDDSHRQRSTTERLILLETPKRFYQPMEIPLTLAQAVSIMIRSGYQDRNPFDMADKRRILKCVDEFDPDFYDDAGITTSGLTLLGLSGMGKSRAVNRILSFIYQVIHHREYQGRPFTCSQIVWLKLDCPHNGSIKALCGACLQAVDSLLGTDYFRRGAQNGKASVNTLIAQMAIVAANHYLGVLVIDEIQNIRGSKEGTQLLNFLVQLSNEIGIPMVLVGTPSAQGVLTSAFRQARRGTGYGNFLWHHMKAERNGGNGDWEVFVRSLFRYQYVHEVAVLTPKLSDALLETSGGITDLAIKMFIAAQRRAITTGTERITPGLIRSVAHDEFPWTIEAVKALKKGTPSALRRYDDLYFEQEKSSMPKVTAPATASPPPKKKKSVTATEEPDWQAAETEAELPETTQVGLADTHTAETPQPEIGPTLVGIVAQGSEREQPAYEAVQAAGLIWSTDSHLTPSE